MKYIGYPIFQKTTYNWRFPFRSIKYFFKDLKACWQRITRGWSDQDTWNIDAWFECIVPDMLEYLRRHTHGYPATMSEKEWNDELKKMVKLFREANEDTCSVTNGYKIGTRQWVEQEQFIYSYRDACLKKAFGLFAKYFWNLWD